MGHSTKGTQRQVVTKILVISMMMAFSSAIFQTAEAEQSMPAYADTLRRAVVFENESGNKLSLTDRMERWKVPA